MSPVPIEQLKYETKPVLRILSKVATQVLLSSKIFQNDAGVALCCYFAGANPNPEEVFNV